MRQWRMGKRFGDCSSAGVSCGDCMNEQSTSASEKTHACDWGQNQMEHAVCMHCEMLMYASADWGGESHYVTERKRLVAD
jgi:hypothetical protein